MNTDYKEFQVKIENAVTQESLKEVRASIETYCNDGCLRMDLYVSLVQFVQDRKNLISQVARIQYEYAVDLEIMDINKH